MKRPLNPIRGLAQARQKVNRQFGVRPTPKESLENNKKALEQIRLKLETDKSLSVEELRRLQSQAKRHCKRIRRLSREINTQPSDYTIKGVYIADLQPASKAKAKVRNGGFKRPKPSRFTKARTVNLKRQGVSFDATEALKKWGA
ncbi:MAG: hypothetical protein MN733_14605 [Nitrososphaera sp.]|nr:hypothetical protein [Nitrososphaera sp.]